MDLRSINELLEGVVEERYSGSFDNGTQMKIRRQVQKAGLLVKTMKDYMR